MCQYSSSQSSMEQRYTIDLPALLTHFQHIQDRHQRYRVSQRRRKVVLWDQQPANE